jgi:outer membrane protein OmpA-like peptidoglycan-associated protein
MTVIPRIAFIFSLLSFHFALSQNSKLKVGDVASEKIQYMDYKNAAFTSNVPANNHTLFYRYRDTLGNTDNADSIAALEKIVEDLQRLLEKSADFKYLHVECHGHIKNYQEIARLQKKIDSTRNVSYKMNNLSHGWSFIYLDETKQKISSVLNAGKLCLVGPKGRILMISSIGNFSANMKDIVLTRMMRGKLLTEEAGKKTALSSAMITLLKADQSKAGETVTDKYGDFELELPDPSISYTLTAKPTSTSVTNVILATQTGIELSKFRRNKNGFQFPLLKADIQKLTETPVDDDISLSFDKFKGGKQSVMKITEHILYASGQSDFDPKSIPILDKVLNVLSENPKIQLEVISHTDSQGDEAANLLLSEKRAKAVVEYLATKGIDKGRLKAIGKGEGEVRNRCKNGVDCSDKEHSFNRRTEFNFIKG